MKIHFRLKLTAHKAHYSLEGVKDFVEFCEKNLLSCVPFSYTPLISKEHDGDDVNKGTE